MWHLQVPTIDVSESCSAVVEVISANSGSIGVSAAAALQLSHFWERVDVYGINTTIWRSQIPRCLRYIPARGAVGLWALVHWLCLPNYYIRSMWSKTSEVLSVKGGGVADLAATQMSNFLKVSADACGVTLKIRRYRKPIHFNVANIDAFFGKLWKYVFFVYANI